MTRIRRLELFQPSYTYYYDDDYPSVYLREASIFDDFSAPWPASFDLFHGLADLIPPPPQPRRIHAADLVLDRLSHRVAELESRFDRLARIGARTAPADRKYTWTTEIKSPERRCKVTAEIKDGRKERAVGKSYKWTAEIEGRGSDGPISRTYAFKAWSGDAGESKKKKEKKSDKEERASRVVLIEEPSHDHGALVLRQAFARRIGRNDKGKKKEVSPQDAALIIQIGFRAYLIRRSKALRALRDLAVAKTKLKELRTSFNNFSYRRFVSRDAEERQRFTEKIIVLLLTVDAIEGADRMVRAAKRSMVDELEAMLDVVDPQPTKRSLSMRRRTFDMPDGVIQKEIAAGVAEVVQMLNHEENIANTFEACL